MALPTGAISMSQVNTELGRSAGASINLNDGAVRGLAGKASGIISMGDLRGKSAFSVSVGGYIEQVNSGGRPVRYFDRLNASVNRPAGAPAPTAHVWGYEDYTGMIIPSGGLNAVFSLTGPSYTQGGFTMSVDVDVWCDVTINGTVYRTPTRRFVFTRSGDEI